MGYADIQRRLDDGGIVILDGGTGTELERRGVKMDPKAWCGPASLDHLSVLEAIHKDYIEAGADIITANTYASSPLMLAPAGFANRFEEINRGAIEAAHRARQTSGNANVLIAGSLSHMIPMIDGSAKPDIERTPSPAEMAEAFGRLASLHQAAGCDLILLEMMYHPERMQAAFQAAMATGLPVFAGFSARGGEDGRALSFAPDRDMPFDKVGQILAEFDVAAAGIMHTPSNLIGEAISILRETFDGPLMAYPDSGYFKMPHWQFEDIIAPDDFYRFGAAWAADGVQVIGGCCGLSPEHIAAIAPLRNDRPEAIARSGT